MEPIRVLELRSVRGTGGGPEKTIMLGAAQADPREFAVTVCYIRDVRDAAFRLDERARTLGIEYVEVHERHSFDPAIWSALRRLVRERNIQIVHAHEYKTDLLALMLGEREAVIPLSTVHGWTGHSGRERHFYYPLDRRLLARYPRLVAVSGQIRDELVASGTDPRRVSVILNAIDPDRFRRDPARVASARARFGCNPGDFVVGAVGRLEPQKRFDLLIEAIARLRPAFPNLRLMIAGEGSSRAALEAQLATALPGGAGILLGHVDDVTAVHEAMNLFVQSSDYEGTPNSVLEAMALESPVVATDAGGTGEVAHHGVHALIVRPGDAAVLAAAIEEALQDPAAAAVRRTAARRRVEGDLSFATRMRHLEDIYRELVRPGAVRRTGLLRWS